MHSLKTIAGALLVFTLCCNSMRSQAQDFSGTWEGNFGKGSDMVQPEKIIMELFRKNDTLYSGATHLYYRNEKYEHYKVTARFDVKTNSLVVSEDTVLSFKLMFGATRSAGTYSLKTENNSNGNALWGYWTTNRRVLFQYRTVTARFARKTDPTARNENADVTVTATVKKDSVLDRHPDIQSLVEIDPKTEDTIKAEIYDNGIIDDDSVSLYFDDSLVVSKQRITDKPLLFMIPAKNMKAISKLKLVAESLGSVPPCTALLIVTTGRKRYEINLSSNFSQNAVVEFLLKE